jgi:hypothetical protein
MSCDPVNSEKTARGTPGGTLHASEAECAARDEADDAAPFEKYWDAVDDATARTIGVLFPTLPDWPEWLVRHLRHRMRRSVLALHAADQTDERIAAAVALARQAITPDVPGSAPSAAEYIQAAYDLANIQWALTLEKADAIRELAGDEAAKNYKRSAAGVEGRTGLTAGQLRERDLQIVAKADAMKLANPRLGDRGAARIIGPEFGLSQNQVRKILAKGR